MHISQIHIRYEVLASNGMSSFSFTCIICFFSIIIIIFFKFGTLFDVWS